MSLHVLGSLWQPGAATAKRISKQAPAPHVFLEQFIGYVLGKEFAYPEGMH